MATKRATVAPTGGPQQTPSTWAQALLAAAKRWNVPSSLLEGVFGKETGFGKNVATSSTGAMGLMQFEPETAAAYNYPMTNSPSMGQAQQQFDAAAHYLADLHAQTGSWNTAVQRYSGGGYDLAAVQATAKTGGSLNTGSSWDAGATPSIPNPLSSVSAAITNAVNTATSDAKYAAVLVAVLALGVMLIHHALSPTGAQRRQVMVLP